MAPRRRPGPTPRGPTVADLRRMVEERRRAPPSSGGDPAEDPGAWAPGEEWLGPQDDPEGTASPGARSRFGSGWWEDGPPAKPIRVEGGLVARTRRGRIGSTWWSQRFLAAIEGVMEGGRPDRGRAYARRGQVLSLDVRPGVIEARVQGSRTTPYRVRLSMAVVDEPGWEGIVAALSARAGYAARMLAGELPHEVEEVFAGQGSSLFPGPGARLVTECTCPDWANPCKHVAAVCYLVAESFDEDPFAVLAWRGRDRETLLAALRRLRAGAVERERRSTERAAGGRSAGSRQRPGGDGDLGSVPLAPHAADWWRAGGGLDAVRVRPERAAQPDAVLRGLPAGVVELGGTDLADLLAPLYAELTAAAALRALGDG